MRNVFKLFVSVAVPLFVGFFGSFFTSSSVGSWYKTINRPFFNPPDWIFAPVWTILFILIGLSFYLVWINGFGKNKFKVVGVFSLQLFFNFLWSLFFFGLRSPFLALVDIFLLWFAILVNIFVFYKVSKVSAFLLVPYFLWVSFALVLNFSIVVIN